MVFKCKICGGNLEIKEGTSVVTCDYCGVQQTLPKLESDRVSNLYDRANHFLRNNEYDKAEAMYETILNEEPNDSEAYWSLVLCKYGVEYVKDSKTEQYIPTCNRTQNTSILADENYKQALKYASEEQKELYKTEAEKINSIQKGILEISSKEEPYDVFICYKETDENGERTEDSVMAQEIYNNLEKEGLKVFFSRISLEDKIGTAYEPYIFSALNSANVMIVVGTTKENLQAVWVRNEWSRYLALIKEGAEKTLIPCFKGMDAYDLPEEFAHLQAQDMSKIGVMQDLTRGVKKIINSNQIEQNGNVQINSMTKEQKEKIYKLAKKDMQLTIDAKVLSHREKAKIFKNLTSDFEKIGSHIDASTLAKKCRELYKKEKRKNLLIYLKVLIIITIIVTISGTLLIKFYIEPKNKYESALEKYNHNEYYSAIKAFSEMEDYQDSKQLIQTAKNNWKKSNISTISGASDYILGVKEMGTVLNLSSVFNDFSNISQIEVVDDYSNEYIFGLKEDGTVTVTVEQQNNYEIARDWTNVVAIKASNEYIFGLKDNGTVLSQRYKENQYGDSKNIDTSSWEQIVQIVPCLGGIVGLKEDGTLVHNGIEAGSIIKIGEWKDVVQLTGARDFLIALKEDGTLVGTGSNAYNLLNLENETNVIQLSNNYYYSNHFAFIKADGTVKAVGANDDGQCDVSTFDNVIFVYAGDTYTLGITKEKKALIQGSYGYDDSPLSYYTDVWSWSGIKIYDEWRSVK